MISRLFLGLIRLYQLTFSSIMGTQCRFNPSCSNYTAEAIRRFGAWRGVWLGISRIGRCHPWNRGGNDPVPDIWQKHSCCDKNGHP